MKTTTLLAVAFCLLLLPTFAQYEIQSTTISSVTKISSGGGFSLVGSVSQPAVGRSTTGSFSMESGSIGIIAVVPTPGGPKLTLTLSTTNTVILRWPHPSTGFQLQQAPVIPTDAWSPVAIAPVQAGSEWQVILTPPDGNRFYRLKSP